MLEFVFGSALDAKLEEMLNRLDHLENDIAQELTDWQVQDMNRKYPKTDQTTGESKTSIWPRSRLNTPRRRSIAAKAKTRTGGGSSKGFVRKQRPILRPVLVQSLHERMRNLAHRTLSWQ